MTIWPWQRLSPDATEEDIQVKNCTNWVTTFQVEIETEMGVDFVALAKVFKDTESDATSADHLLIERCLRSFQMIPSGEVEGPPRSARSEPRVHNLFQHPRRH